MTTAAATPTTTAAMAPTTAAARAAGDLLSIADLSPAEVAALFDRAAAMKASPREHRSALDGAAVVMLFEKPSLRTRCSFELGIAKLGGHAMYFDHAAQRIGQREPVRDYGLNLERWADAIVARVHDHAVLEQLAEAARIPVVNALSDREHPCQALADFFTLKERLGPLDRVRLAFVGDGNNVCHSLVLAAAAAGSHLTVITPRGFEPQFSVLRAAEATSLATGATITVTNRLAAVAGHHAVYTDAWTSMGQDHQAELRAQAFCDYQVDEGVMARASAGVPGGAIFMHCLPAHRGEEVDAAVIDGPASVVYDQAENRMHVQNALLVHLLAGRDHAPPGRGPSAG